MKKNKKCLEGHTHMYVIIKGSGKINGIPTWKCKICNNLVKSN